MRHRQRRKATTKETQDRGRKVWRPTLAWQVLIVVVIFGAWQWIPTIPGAADVSPALDPFFISSPTRVASTLYELTTGANNTEPVWDPFLRSIIPAITGTALAVLIGAVAGLVCSNWESLNRVVRPFLVLFNALPRIVLIPIVIVIAGPTTTANILVGFLVVFFLIFFNAYAGGVSVPQEALDNARILGAGPGDVLRMVRWPHVLAWTFAQLPNAVAFGVTAIVTAELFGGAQGLGRLLLNAVQTADADLTVAVAVLLGLTSLMLIGIAEAVRGRMLHWQ
jgi:NitT/TauT family transport system permease protein